MSNFTGRRILTVSQLGGGYATRKWSLFSSAGAFSSLASLLCMASMTTYDDGTLSEAPSTCSHWTASDDEEEEVIEVDDAHVAIMLSNENVNQSDGVCVSGVPYETNKEKHEAIEVKSAVANTEIAYEIEVDWEDMPQEEAQDVLVPPSGNSVESVCASICKDLEKTMHHFADTLSVELVLDENMEEKQFDKVRLRFKDCSSHASSSHDTSGSSTVTGTTLRKSTRNGKKRIEPNAPSDDLVTRVLIIGHRDTMLQKFGSDFLVKKHDKPDSWWVHEDELRDSDAGCEAMEVFDKKRRRK